MSVYFISDGEFVKIGVASDPEQRIKALQTSTPHPLELLCTLEGDYPLERKLHTMFADYRASGEWFKLNARIMDVVEGRVIVRVRQTDREHQLNRQDYADIFASGLTLLKNECAFRIGIRPVPQKGERPPGLMVYVSGLTVGEDGRIVALE